MSDIKDLIKRVIDFRNRLDWEQFDNPKDTAITLSLEAAEVLEHFQWKNGQELEEYAKTHKEEIGEELADVLYSVFIMSHYLGLDMAETFNKKMDKNEKKYPVEKFKGTNKKYNEL